MAKLVSLMEDAVGTEWPLETREVLIGRGSDCEVQLNDPSVSRHHAKLVRIYTGYFIEDLESTNGVVLNGRRVRKHILKGDDIFHIGNIELKFVDERQSADADPNKTVVLSRPPDTQAQRQRIAAPPPSEQAGQAYVRVLSGPDQGDSRSVDKSLYTIGEPGGNLAVISRRAQGYFLMHLGGDQTTTLNGNAVHGAGVRLNSGDVIEVGDLQLEFYAED